jgi:hypothetical protein
MSIQSARELTRSGAAGALMLAALAALPAMATAQEGSIRESGPIVTVEADGSGVKVAGAAVTVTGTAESVAAAGASVTVRATVANDLSAAGGSVVVNGDVGGDVKVAGASVTARGNFAGDLFAGGAVVILNATVAGEAKVGGANVTLGPLSDIAGGLEGGGANLTLSGHVGGDLRMGGANVIINGQLDGDVTIFGGQVTVNAPAVIGGDLIIRSAYEPVISEAATIGGEVRKLGLPDWGWAPDVAPWAIAAGLAGFVVLGTILAGIVLMLFGGRVFVTGIDHVRLRPGSSFLLGVATVVLVPTIAALLIGTVAGLSVGIAILMILPFLAVFGHTTAAAGVASGIFVRGRAPLGLFKAFVMLVIGAIIIALVFLIPWAGPFLVLIVLLIGIGAIARTLGGRMRRVEPEPA